MADTMDTIYYFKTTIANRKIEIECCYKNVFQLCRNYLSDFEKPDFTVSTSISEIREEGAKEYRFSDKYLEYLIQSKGIAIDFVNTESSILLRKIADHLIDYSVLLMHGAAIAINNKCFIFIAPSGTGKTTHIKKWIKMIPGTIVVNGDKPFVDAVNKKTYGSPWCGKENMNTNTCVPLAGLIYLERGSSNDIKQIPFGKMIPYLLQHCYIPADQELAIKAYRLVGQLNKIPCYLLKCNLDDKAALVAYEKLSYHSV